ncbi:hypothetical protein GYMLUDRAFT_33607 [Collybiopsis luxurians FD-317 M1]|nr:hypothetical protein GYMLUDRAFT_33607 [Collybiopsis luxurians FD-317 M1]
MARSNRPRPLSNTHHSSFSTSSSSSSPSVSVSAYPPYSSTSAYDYQSLTPRTPHSRSGAYEDIPLADRDHREDEEEEEDTQNQSVSSPLLPSASPSSARRTEDDKTNFDWTMGWNRLTGEMIIQRLPVVVGCFVAGLFFFLILVAYRSPGTLEYYVGVTTPNTTDASANSSFPLSSNPETQIDPSLLISYENYTTFPLRPTEYVSECYTLNPGRMKHTSYWGEAGVPVKDVPHPPPKEGTCSSTITYMLDGRIGLASDLALMAQVAALARERNRTFLIDDTYWNRGKWTDHFQDVRQTQPGPEPGCLPPPPEELVACPRQVRHWIVNSHTAKFHLGPAFSDYYEDAYARNLNRLEPIFNRASTSLSQTIQPSEENAALIRDARKELREVMIQSNPNSNTNTNNAYVGVHLRRGDQKAAFTKGPWGYVPLENYVQAVQDIQNRLFSSSASESGSDVAGGANMVAYLASDDPVAIESFEDLLNGDGGEENQNENQIQITTYSLHKSTSPTLRSLVASQSRSSRGYIQSDFNALEDGEERVKLTRGVVVDMALISGLWSVDVNNDGDLEEKEKGRGKEEVMGEGGGEEGAAVEVVRPEAVVCTIGSSICLLSAIPFTWARAFGDMEPKPNGLGYPNRDKQRWLDIDEKGAVVPAWNPFRMF